jgi:type VI secretion system protein ImpK
MTPAFAHAVDPIFERVLALLDRIDAGAGGSVDAEREKSKIVQLFETAHASLGDSKEWGSAKYALACWTDEVLIAANWPAGGPYGWWTENSLETSLFNTRDRNEQFYVWALEASQLTRRDALEVYYLAVILGFRGLYEDPRQAATIAPRFQLPPQLETWVKRTADVIKLTPRPPVTTSKKLGPGAPPLKGRSTLVSAVLSSSVLAAIFGILAYITWALN